MGGSQDPHNRCPWLVFELAVAILLFLVGCTLLFAADTHTMEELWPTKTTSPALKLP